MRPKLYPPLAVICGFVFAFIIVGAAEEFFRLNLNYGWLRPASPGMRPADSNPQLDLSDLDLDYLKNLKPYDRPHDFDDPDDYSSAYQFSDCAENQMSLIPPWLASPDCHAHILLHKQRSHRVVFDVHYDFDSHGRRKIPSSVANSPTTLLFLGCSFTYGEGVENSEMFPEVVSHDLAPVNAYNLGMGGYGPNHVLQLLNRPATDIRLNDIGKRSGVAIYTFIDHHIDRLIGSSAWLGEEHHKSGPYYDFNNQGQLELRGTFETARPVRTWLYGIAAESELLKFFGVRLPIIGDREMQLFAEAAAEMKNLVKEKFGIETFVVVIYPEQYDYVDRLKPLLEKRGINVFDFSTVGFTELMHGRHVHLGNWHPTANAHRLYGDLIARELLKRGLVKSQSADSI